MSDFSILNNLLDSDRVEKLVKAGVDARLKVWEGMCTRFA